MSKRLQFRTFLNHFSVLEDNTILTFKPYRKASPIVNNKLCHMELKKENELINNQPKQPHKTITRHMNYYHKHEFKS